MTPLVSALVDAVVYLLGRACAKQWPSLTAPLRDRCGCEACELRERLEREAT